MELKKLLSSAPAEIKEHFTENDYKKNELIIRPYESNDYFYIITSGYAEVYHQNSHGSMVTIMLYNPYSCLGEIEIFNQSHKTVSVISKTRCTVLKLESKYFLKWLALDHNFSLYIIRQLTDKLENSSNIIQKICFLTVKDRILSSISSYNKMGKLSEVTKHNLVCQVSTPMRSLNRAFERCINEGFISYKNKKISVVNQIELDRYLNNLGV